jgi:hypothetical protein
MHSTTRHSSNMQSGIAAQFLSGLAFQWRIKKSIRNDIRKHGLGDTAQIAVGVGSMGIALPPISGIFATAAGGTMLIGAAVTEIVARKQSNRWERKYSSMKTVTQTIGRHLAFDGWERSSETRVSTALCGRPQAYRSIR